MPLYNSFKASPPLSIALNEASSPKPNVLARFCASLVPNLSRNLIKASDIFPILFISLFGFNPKIENA